MKKHITKFMALFALLALGSCADDNDAGGLTYAGEVNFPAAIQATPGSVVLNPGNKYEQVLTISWPEVAFHIDAPVTYAIQFSTGNWTTPVTVQAGEDVLSKSFTGGEINNIATGLGFLPDVERPLHVRVLATMNRTIYSESITVDVTPFEDVISLAQLYMPGDYQGWNPATASVLTALENGVFRGYVTFLPGQGLNFKFTPEADWDEFYGLDGNGNLTLQADGDMVAPGSGSYQVDVNLNTMTYTLTPYSWGVVGTSTVGGWDVDTDMVYDHTASEWSFTGALVPGALKFRLNDGWAINYGPVGEFSGNQPDGTVNLDASGAHSIIQAGTYKVTFKLNPDPATARYTVLKLD